MDRGCAVGFGNSLTPFFYAREPHANRKSIRIGFVELDRHDSRAITLMKYTRNDSGEVIEVKGCTTCPHVNIRQENGWGVMFCMKPPRGKGITAGKKLIGKWTGAYHASCPLASAQENVPAVKEVVK